MRYQPLRRSIASPDIEAGSYYRDRRGHTVGPLQHDYDEWNPWYFTDGMYEGREGWRRNGQFWNRSKPEYDLVVEVDAPHDE